MSATTIHIFHTGKVLVDQAVPLYEKNPLAATGLFRSKKKKVALPVSVYLINHEKGRILIDTGWHSDYVSQKPSYFLGIIDKISHPILAEGESIDCHLARLGLSDTDIDYLFFSHLDFDHASGTALVSGAKHIMASDEEIAQVSKNPFRYLKSNWSMVKLKAFSFKQTGIGPMGRSYDVFGDGSVQLVHTPGHSQGHCSVKITGSDGRYVILGGDAAYLQESFEQHIIPGITNGKSLAQKSLDWLLACRSDSKCLGVYVNHDPSVVEQTIALS